MTLAYLGELKSIWNGPAQYAIFHNLKVLTVSECRKLKTIFTTYASHYLMQLELEELQVYDCSSLETIIGASEGTLEDKIIFSQLRYKSLRSLPELKSFYSGGSGGLMNTTTTLVPNRHVLEKLEELYVNRLNDLKELCVGDLPHGSLGSLKL
ncbi:hypothetical protein CerSpe_058280 [Prunus speciosa]